MHRPARNPARLAVSLLAIVGTLFVPFEASAEDRGPHVLRLELGGAYSFRAHDDRDTFGFGGGFGYEARLGRFVGIVGHLQGYAFPYDTSEFAGSGFGTYYALGVGVRLHLAPAWQGGDLWVEGLGDGVLTGGLLRAGMHAGLGVDVYVGRGFAVGPFARYVHVFQQGSAQDGGADGRFAQLGVALSWGRVRTEPSESTEPTEPSEEPSDADGDGIDDARDVCPDRAEDHDGHDDEDGCPDEDPATADAAGPSTSSSAPATQTSASDPAGERTSTTAEPRAERMPRQPPRERTPRARAAAPSGGADSDGDGIDDAHDRCPHRAEDHDGYQDDDGCPEASPDEDVDDPRALLELHVTYALNAAALPPRFAAELRAIARALTRDPSIRGVRIVGHADELGDPGYNQDLSERRARVVLEFLVRHGVASDRLEAVGVGSSQPIVHGASPLELAPNRRVEFIVLDARPAGAR